MPARNAMNGFWSAQDYWCIQSSFLYRPERVTLDKYVICEEQREWTVYLPFTTPIDIFLNSVIKRLIRYSETSTCCQFNTSSRTSTTLAWLPLCVGSKDSRIH
ncbi:MULTISPECIES: hypothetical protein [unclassified Endozoicomonas]|uniref:hypothetical protein n=1 Tax=unclassified Endozoicomonas TaxID=2644528 RepID=UPI003BB69F42